MANPAYVQSNGSGTLGAGNLSFFQSYTNAQTAGNCNLVCLCLNASSPVSVTDTSGNNYQFVAYQPGSGGYTAYVYVAFGIKAAAAGANTVTVTYSPALTFPELIIAEYSSAVAEIAAASAAGVGTTPTSPTIAPASANELLFGFAFGSSATTMSAAGGATFRQTSTFWDGIEDSLSVSTAPVAMTFGSTNSVNWVCFIIAISSVSTPTCSPVGGHHDLPTVVTMSCQTPGSSVYYTTDGSTPTTASTLYTAPVVIASGTIKLSMVAAIGTNLSHVRVIQFYIQSGGLWVTTDDQFDITTGQRVYQFESCIMYDPPSGYWYKYGDYFDTLPSGQLYIYQSADLLNWTLVANYGYIAIRPCVLYNALNNNYVMWGNYITSNNGKASFVASSPVGPFIQVNYYDTWQSINIDTGDSSAFLDPNTGKGYFLTECNGNTDLMVVQLSADFKSLTNTFALTTSSAGEAATMWSNGPGSYFLLQSGQSNYAPNPCTYQWANSPLGPWAAYSGGGNNPYQAATITQTAAEVTAGITATNANSYDTQCCQVILIPGRKAYFYHSDRYDSGANPLPNYRRIVLPMSQNSQSFGITWAETWNLNTAFPTISGAPWPPNYLSVIKGVARWINSDPLAHNLYLDFATDQNFTQNVRSELIAIGSSRTLTNTYTLLVAPPDKGFYRLRAVNANGSAVSLSANPATTANILATFAPSKARKLYNLELLKDEMPEEEYTKREEAILNS